MIIAVQLYTLRDYLKTPDQIAASFQKIKSIGYNAIQIAGVGPIEPQLMKQMADEAGLTICSAYLPYDAMIDDIEQVIRTLQLWNSRYVGVGSLPASFSKTASGFAEFARSASAVGRQLREAGVTFTYHNHSYEFGKFDGKTGMDILMEESDPDHFHFELDVHWVQAGGADPVQWLYKMNGRTKTVHLKDMNVVDSERRYAEVGEGNMNFTAILKACENIGVEWAPVEQDLCYGRNPFESLAVSRRHLQRMGATF